MTKRRFFICRHCGNIVGMVFDAKVPMTCCGEVMEELVPNTVDAAQEKHVPVVTVEGNMVTVKVGSAEHPMTEAHLINWIYIETEKGGQRKVLQAGEAPEAKFALVDDKAIAAYAYCNLHSLWVAEI